MEKRYVIYREDFRGTRYYQSVPDPVTEEDYLFTNHTDPNEATMFTSPVDALRTAALRRGLNDMLPRMVIGIECVKVEEEQVTRLKVVD